MGFVCFFLLVYIESTRFPLAEYRYGREEMLSLYDKTFKLPELLPKFNKLFIEKMQCPLALLPPTADEETVNIIEFTLFFHRTNQMFAYS